MHYEQDIKISVENLRKGKIILYPTDTIWGIGCDATNYEAVKTIYEIKQRENSKSMIVLICSIDELENYVENIPPKALDILKNATRPMTIIYPKAKNLAKNAIADDGSIAIRISKDDFCADLIKSFGKPIISTSANISGEIAPQNFSEISKNIKNKVDYIVKWRQDDVSKSAPSAIILVKNNNEIVFLRK